MFENLEHITVNTRNQNLKKMHSSYALCHWLVCLEVYSISLNWVLTVKMRWQRSLDFPKIWVIFFSADSLLYLVEIYPIYIYNIVSVLFLRNACKKEKCTKPWIDKCTQRYAKPANWSQHEKLFSWSPFFLYIYEHK